MPDRDETLCCVVLATSPSLADAALRAALTERQWRPIVFDDAGLAMAEACLQARSHAARRGWGLSDGSPPALVIDASGTPRDIDEIRNLCRAMKRYAPRVPIVLFRRGALEVLTGPSAPQAAGGSTAPAVTAPGGARPPARSETVPSRAASEDGASADTDAWRISSEEIDMLLGDPGGSDAT